MNTEIQSVGLSYLTLVLDVGLGRELVVHEGSHCARSFCNLLNKLPPHKQDVLHQKSKRFGQKVNSN